MGKWPCSGKTRNFFLASVTTGFFFVAAFAPAAQKKNAARSSGSILAADKGKFSIVFDGKTVGHEDFEISSTEGGWTARGTTELRTSDAPEGIRVAGTLILQSDGVPIRYEWTSQGDKTNAAHVLFANGVAKITLEMQGARPFEQDLTFGSPLIAVLDDNLYHQYAILARLYDWSKRGAQTFPVIIPQELTPGSIIAEATGSSTAGGKSYEGLRVNTSDLEVLLLLDANHRLMRLEVPSAKVSVVRQ